MVAISRTFRALSAVGSIILIFCSRAALAISSTISRLLFDPAGPSVPMPTLTPAIRTCWLLASRILFPLVCQ